MHCNIPQHTATHCNSPQRTATHCNTLQHTAMHCNALQRTAPHCTTLHRTAPHCNTLQRTATHHNALHALQRTATHCNTLNCIFGTFLDSFKNSRHGNTHKYAPQQIFVCACGISNTCTCVRMCACVSGRVRVYAHTHKSDSQTHLQLKALQLPKGNLFIFQVRRRTNCTAECCRVLQGDALSCSVLQCLAVSCSVLHTGDFLANLRPPSRISRALPCPQYSYRFRTASPICSGISSYIGTSSKIKVCCSVLHCVAAWCSAVVI